MKALTLLFCLGLVSLAGYASPVAPTQAVILEGTLLEVPTEEPEYFLEVEDERGGEPNRYELDADGDALAELASRRVRISGRMTPSGVILVTSIVEVTE